MLDDFHHHKDIVHVVHADVPLSDGTAPLATHVADVRSDVLVIDLAVPTVLSFQ